MKLSESICPHNRLFQDCEICTDEVQTMFREQRKAAKIGGKPCEWDREQWAAWSAKDDE